jgi:hypothetical protein
MVLAYLGVQRTQEQIGRTLSLIEMAGIPASRIVRLATRELNVQYQVGSLDAIRSWLEQAIPVIAFVEAGELPYYAITPVVRRSTPLS